MTDTTPTAARARELAEASKHWDFCPICRHGLDTGLECDSCGYDMMPIVKALQAFHDVPEPAKLDASHEVKRWNASFTAAGCMQEHNGDLIRSGIGPYVLAEHYDRLSRTLAAIEKARAIERKARQRLQTELLALCTQHVGGELDPDNANPAGNSHHE